MAILTITDERVFDRFVKDNKSRCDAGYRVYLLSTFKDSRVSRYYNINESLLEKTSNHVIRWAGPLLDISRDEDAIIRYDDSINYRPHDLLVVFNDICDTIIHIPTKSVADGFKQRVFENAISVTEV